jgi:hypothetical protein
METAEWLESVEKQSSATGKAVETQPWERASHNRAGASYLCRFGDSAPGSENRSLAVADIPLTMSPASHKISYTQRRWMSFPSSNLLLFSAHGDH